MTINITPIPNNPKYNRLKGKDILRLPDKERAKKDFFVRTIPQNTVAAKKSLRKKLYTIATFGLVGACLAHKNNLFNPIYREAKSVINNEKYQNRIKKFVDENLLPKTYIQAVRNFLTQIIEKKKHSKNIIQQAENTLNNKTRLNELMTLVNKALNDDNTTLKEGYAADLLDKVFIKLQEDLLRNKKERVPYLKQGLKTATEYLDVDLNGTSTLHKFLYDVIIKRSSAIIDEFLKNAAIDTKFGSKV